MSVCLCRKALESLASRGVDDGKEQMQREMDTLREVFNVRIQELEEVIKKLRANNDENLTFLHVIFFLFSLCTLLKKNWKTWPSLQNRRS